MDEKAQELMAHLMDMNEGKLPDDPMKMGFAMGLLDIAIQIFDATDDQDWKTFAITELSEIRLKLQRLG